MGSGPAVSAGQMSPLGPTGQAGCTILSRKSSGPYGPHGRLEPGGPPLGPQSPLGVMTLVGRAGPMSPTNLLALWARGAFCAPGTSRALQALRTRWAPRRLPPLHSPTEPSGCAPGIAAHKASSPLGQGKSGHECRRGEERRSASDKKARSEGVSEGGHDSVISF